jgi:hypothetical protein
MPGEPTLSRRHPHSTEWVVYAQQLLNQALAGGMHLDIAEDGKFTVELEEEIKAFQSRHGLAADGSVGPTTWAALHKAIGAKQHAASDDNDLPSPAREVHNAPGHRDDNTFHQRTDQHGNTVRVYDVDAETITGTPGGQHDWNTVVSLMIEKAEKNVGEQIPYVLSGIVEFQQSSHAKIVQWAAASRAFEEAAHVQFPWGLLVDGLDHALGVVFTVEGYWAGWVYEKVKGAFLGSLKEELESRASQVPGLQAQLEQGVAAMVDRANRETRHTVDDIRAGIKDHIKEQMENYQQVTSDADWIEEMVTYFGFPASTESRVTQPILHSLNQQLDAMLQQAGEDLVRTA